MNSIFQRPPEALQNLLLGIAIGDAFGAGVEFQDRDWIREHVDFKEFVDARKSIQVPLDQLDAFTENYAPWQYTDDTEMTVGILHALTSNEPFTTESVISALEAEYKRGFQLNGHGRNGHGSLRWYFEGTKSLEEILEFQRNRPNPGNAPAVRAVPLGLVDAHLINEVAAINANATHPNSQAIIASQCIARAAEFLLVKEGEQKEVVQYCLKTVPLNADYQHYLQLIDELPGNADLSESDFETLCGPQPIQAPYFLAGIKGLPSDSKFTAGAILWVLKHSQDPFDALKKSILMGGDVDSLAAVTTGILACRFGLDSLPSFMLQNVEGSAYLRGLALRFAESRP